MTEKPPQEAQPDSLTFELLCDAWAAQAIDFDNITEDRVLFQDEARVIFLDADWGPPIPYPPAPRPDCNENHGYVATKGNPEAIAAIPELHGWPEYEALILAINCSAGQTESAGCEKGYFDCDSGAAKIYLGSYTDVVFSDPSDNTAENHLRLASEIGRAMFEAWNWWGKVELGIQRMRGHCWGLNVKIINFGRDADEARKWWGHSAGVIEEVFAAKGREADG